MNAFKFKLKTYLEYGEGKIYKLGEFLRDLEYRNIGIIVDKAVSAQMDIRKGVNSLETAGIKYELFVSDAVEPDYDYLEKYKNNFLNKGFDCLVGIGGGSVLDLTKGIATLVTNSGEAISFRGFPKLAHAPLPVVAIPTTAGTGSEVTYNAVFTDSRQMKKLGINSELNHPVLAIIDPLLTVNAPVPVTVSSGADALVHALESYVHKHHTPVSRMYSKEAFRLLYNNLNKVLEQPDDRNIRGEIALGAYLAGVALINAGSGPSGAFSYPLGTHFKVPHGYAGAIFIPEVTRINVEKGYQDYAALYDLIEGGDASLNIVEKNKKFADAIAALMDRLGVPEKLMTFGLTDKDIQFMVDQYDVLKAAIDQNPIEINRDDTRAIMNKVFKARERMSVCRGLN